MGGYKILLDKSVFISLIMFSNSSVNAGIKNIFGMLSKSVRVIKNAAMILGIMVMVFTLFYGCNKDNGRDPDSPVYQKFIITRLIRNTWGTFSLSHPDTLDNYGTVYLYKDSTAKFIFNTDKYMAYNISKDSSGFYLNLSRWYYQSDTAIVFSKIPYYYSAIVHNDDDHGEFTRFRIESNGTQLVVWRYYFHFRIPDASHMEGEQPEDRYADNKLFLTRVKSNGS
jgi:hypothetical protein